MLVALFAVSACADGSAERAAVPDSAGAQNAPGGDDLVDAPIGADELRRHVRYLASDALAGRGLGTDGLRLAERYIADRLRRAGWAPFPESDSYFAPFTVYEHGYDADKTALTALDAEGNTIAAARYEESLRPFWFSASGSYAGEALFAGYGVSAPEKGYDDYAGLDVSGKLVFVLRHEPPATKPTPGSGERDDDESEWSEHARFNVKARVAKEHGAAGIVVVTDPLYSTEAEDFRALRETSLSPEPPERNDSRLPEGPEDSLAVHVSQRFARAVTASWDHSLEEIQKALNSGEKPATLKAPLPELSLTITRREKPREIAARNVVAVLRGTRHDGPWLLLGAHHDHLGSYAGAGDTLYNGADDNASGTALLLEIAERLSQRVNPVPMNVAVATFSGEEEGLLGSRHTAENGPLDAGSVCHMLNFDMVGRNPQEALGIYGEGRFLRRHVAGGEMESASTRPELEFHGSDIDGYSDFYPYHDAGVSYTFITTGLHSDYHRPSDEAATLSYKHMKRIADLTAHALIGGYQELCSDGAISMTAVSP